MRKSRHDLEFELRNARAENGRLLVSRDEYRDLYDMRTEELRTAQREIHRLTKSPLTERLEAAGAKRLPPGCSYDEDTSDTGAIYIHVTTPRVVDYIGFRAIEAPVTLGKAQILGGVDKAGIIAAANHAYKLAFPKESMDADAKTLLYGEEG